VPAVSAMVEVTAQCGGPTAPNGPLHFEVLPAKPVAAGSSTPPAVIPGRIRTLGVFTSASPHCLDGGDVDLPHRHHRLEGMLCLAATSRKRIG
jgi:hypothetical protein